MRKIYIVGMMTLFVLLLVSKQSQVSAQGMMGSFNSSSDDAVIQNQQQEEQTGKKFMDDLNNKITACPQLNDSDFEKIGEYFMGQSIGNTQRHIAMNDMMKRMMGKKGEEQAHAAMGKRYSGCDPSAAFPVQDNGFLPMMGMLGMMGGNNQWGGKSSGMMGNFYGNNGIGESSSVFEVITWVILIIFLILGIIYFLKGINKAK